MALERCKPDIDLDAITWDNLSPENYCVTQLTEGFVIDGHCEYNCTRFCTDPAILFSERDVFTGCFNERVVFDSSNATTDPWYNSLELDVALNTTFRLIDECMRGYCATPDDALGGCPYQGFADLIADAYDRTDIYLVDVFYEQTGACNVAHFVNSDIGGPGVSSDTHGLADMQQQNLTMC
jgi:hypothetical protein